MEYKWPWQYDFPPFFTLQPNPETRSRQLKLWCELVLEYCEFYKISSSTVNEISNSPLFNNNSILRHLNQQGIMFVLEELFKTGFLEWTSNKNSFLLYFEPIEKISRNIFDWADQTGNRGSVCTLYEIQQIKSPNFDFTKYNEDILIKSFKYLEKTGKASLMMSDNSCGIKFM